MLSGKVIDIFQVSKIEYAELETESDMNLYELYYILKLKPILNDKDIANDELNIELDDLEFRPFYTQLWDTWIEKMRFKRLKQKEAEERVKISKELLKTETSTMAKEILQQQIYSQKYS